MSDNFDPYRKWLGIKSPERPPNYYRILGLEPFEDDLETIENAADRQMAHVRTFQTGRHSVLSQRILNELAAARLCLLNAERKAEYDLQLRAHGFAIQPDSSSSAAPRAVSAPTLPPPVRPAMAAEPSPSLHAPDEATRFSFATERPSLTASRKSKNRAGQPLWIIGAGVILVAVFTAAFWFSSTKRRPTTVTTAAENESASVVASEQQPERQVGRDDRQYAAETQSENPSRQSKETGLPHLNGASQIQIQKRLNGIDSEKPSASRVAANRVGANRGGKANRRRFERSVIDNRRAAEWILSVGGSVSVASLDGVERGAGKLADLPDAPFAVTRIDLNSRPGITGEGLASLSGLTEVKRLLLAGTSVTDADFVHFADMSKLETIELSNTRLSGEGFEHLRPMPALKDLGLMHNGVGDAAAPFISDCTNLEVLLAQDATITDAGLLKLQGLARLKRLNLTGSKVTDVGLKGLSGMSSLKELYLSNLPLSGEGFQQVTGLPSLEVLHLLNDPINDEGIKSVTAFTSLQVLMVQGGTCQVTDSGLSSLSPLIRLRELRVDGSKITGSAFGDLKRLQALEVLGVESTPFNDEGARALAAFSNLRELSMANCAITDVAFASFAKLPKLERLSVQGVALSSDALAQFRSALPKCAVHGP